MRSPISANSAHYNAWANERVYDACAPLSDEERKRRRPSFFGSIHRTLNHILVGDRVWLSRLDGKPHGVTSLDQELYADFAELRAARRRGGRAPERRDRHLRRGRRNSYSPIAAWRRRGQVRPMVQVLGHLFNHQTHHRGQVHGLLSDTPVAPPSLDLISFDWESSIAGVYGRGCGRRPCRAREHRSDLGLHRSRLAVIPLRPFPERSDRPRRSPAEDCRRRAGRPGPPA